MTTKQSRTIRMISYFSPTPLPPPVKGGGEISPPIKHLVTELQSLGLRLEEAFLKRKDEVLRCMDEMKGELRCYECTHARCF